MHLEKKDVLVMVKNPVLIFISVLLILVSCKSRELSPEDKAKVEELKIELLNTQKELSDANTNNEKYQDGLIKLLIQSRIEILKINQSLLEQRINALETGSPVKVEIRVSEPNTKLADEILKEIEIVIQQINNAKIEVEKYSSGLIQSMKLNEIATYEQTLAMLRQKYLEAKYGLISPTALQPQISKESDNPPKITNNTTTNAEISVQDEFEENGNYEFRKTRWGMSIDEVKASENSKFEAEDQDSISYSNNIGGLNTYITYFFSDNQLYMAGYTFNETHVNDNFYITDYNKIKEILIRKYGKPKNEDEIWTNNLYKNNPENYGLAVSVGHLSYWIDWENPSTKIKLALYGDNFNTRHVLRYESIKLKPLVDSKENTEEEKDF